MKGKRATSMPWYRVPLVWLAIALPLAVVGGRVVDDYFRRQEEINRDLARDRAAAARDLKALLQFNARRGEMRIRFNVERAQLPAQIEVRFTHATLAGIDRKMTLTRAPDGSYRTLLPGLPDGRWRVQLAAEDWRLLGSLSLPDESYIEILPAAVPRDR